jgi:PKD repeat protein
MTFRRRGWFVFKVAVVAAVTVAAACTVPPGGGGPTTTTPAAPVAVANASPSIGDAPLSVSFDAAGSDPGSGIGLTYTWDFGDGSEPVSGVTAQHVYLDPGVYFARVTLASTSGTSTSPAIRITVNVDPEPKFYVRQSGSTGPECGPKLRPCASIAEAQANAVAHGIRSIRVATGIYTGGLVMVSDMDISGGWTSDFSDFAVDEESTIIGTATAPAVTMHGIHNASIRSVTAESVTRSSGDAVGLVVSGGSTGIEIGSIQSPRTIVGGGTGPNATGILITDQSTVDLENVTVNSGATVGIGASAYGVRVIKNSRADILLSNIVATAGNDGIGVPENAAVPPQATSGCNGAAGQNAAGSNVWAAGGGGGSCGGWAGGQGGDGGNYSLAGLPGRNGRPISLDFPPSPPYTGPVGGAGGSGGCGSIFGCSPGAGGGRGGAAGASGAAGQAGNNTPQPSDLWVHTPGTAGTPGSPGLGGGGGGGGRSASASGGGGAGGGAGGAGGAAGLIAGTSGGGSFGVYVHGASAEVRSSIVTASPGGAGGHGAHGGRGGQGGAGGKGGNDSCCEAGGGGGGGGGGAGGGGGGAGGGSGGPSIAVYHIGNGVLIDSADNVLKRASFSDGGDGGNGQPASFGGAGGAENDTGGAGTSGGTGTAGPSGADGERGQAFRLWDNGRVVS